MAKILLSTMSPEQRAALKELARKKVSHKIKNLDEKINKERKWNEAQNDVPPVIPCRDDSDKVPVKIDSRTVIMVKRSKCIQKEDGTWVKK